MPKLQDHFQMKDDYEDVEEVDQDTIQEIIASRYVNDQCWFTFTLKTYATQF